jgi:hypothetical protein
VEIDPALVIGVGVFEIIGEAGDGREFIAGLRIEIGIAAR